MTALRTARGWDQIQAGFALGLSKHTVASLERGLPVNLPRAVAEGLARLGLDAGSFAKAYLAWRANEAAKLMASGQAQANG